MATLRGLYESWVKSLEALAGDVASLGRAVSDKIAESADREIFQAASGVEMPDPTELADSPPLRAFATFARLGAVLGVLSRAAHVLLDPRLIDEAGSGMSHTFARGLKRLSRSLRATLAKAEETARSSGIDASKALAGAVAEKEPAEVEEAFAASSDTAASSAPIVFHLPRTEA